MTLKPCPFCGHIGVLTQAVDTHKWWAAICMSCGAQSPEVRWIHADEDPDLSAHNRAIDEWNKRKEGFQ